MYLFFGLEEILNSIQYVDVIIQVDECEYLCYKVILLVMFLYFEVMFIYDMKEN